MQDDPFVHLHVHSDYSVVNGRDGMNKVAELPKTAKSVGQNAVALTDHGLLAGVKKFWDACKTEEVKPIIGCELYCPPGLTSMDICERDEAGHAYYHFLIIARNEAGYRNLVKLTSKAYTEGFYYRPRIDLKTIEQHKEGLLFTSACIGGGLAQTAFDYKTPQHIEWASACKEMFGDWFMLEVQPSKPGLQKQDDLNDLCIKVAKELSIPLIATNDVHYAKQSDWETHAAINAIARHGTVADGYQQSDYGVWFKPGSVMRSELSNMPEEVFTNTRLVADLCDGNYLDNIRMNMPVFPGLEGWNDAHEMLKDISRRGLAKRFSTTSGIPEVYKQRLIYELSVIQQMNYSDYFLIVWDYVKHANDCGITVGPGRGSGAGSLVCWSLGITKPDPIKYGLYFERFLNPARVSMPDLDIDFDSTRIDELIEYVRDKYGTKNVANIGAYQHYFGKGAVRALARAHSEDLSVGSALAKRIPEAQYGKAKLMKDIVASDPSLLRDNPKIIGDALKIDGNVSTRTKHPCGILITADPIDDVIPIYIMRKAPDEIITQLDHEDCESIGGVKFDFLRLDNLTAISKACALIQERHGININPDELPDYDELAYQLLADGLTNSIFQLEASVGMQEAIKQAAPTNIEELSDIIALYRPGPINAGYLGDYMKARKTGRKPQLISPALKKVLGNTQNVPVYQEQMMKLAEILAGFTLAEADLLRRAIGKKKIKEMKKHKPKFITGLQKQSSFTRSQAEELWGQLEGWSNYGFNKAHSISYATVAYQTAWLKSHYPHEFLCAMLHTRWQKSDKVKDILAECKKYNIRVVSADINASQAGFTLAEDGTIVYGLNALKSIGKATADAIANARGSVPFDSVYSFLSRIDRRIVNRGNFATFASVGAFDSLGYSRSTLTSLSDEIYDYFKAMDLYIVRTAAYHERNHEIEAYVETYGDIPGSRKENRSRPRKKKEPVEPVRPTIELEDNAITLSALAAEYRVAGAFLTAHPGDFVENIDGNSYAMDIIDLPVRSERSMILVYPHVDPLWSKGNRYLLAADDKIGGEILTFLTKFHYDQIGNIEEIAIVQTNVMVTDAGSKPPKVKTLTFDVLYKK